MLARGTAVSELEGKKILSLAEAMSSLEVGTLPQALPGFVPDAMRRVEAEVELASFSPDPRLGR
jgi:hypothetical protein